MNPSENPSTTPCPTCHQYDHSSLGGDQVTNAFLHFQAMRSHRGGGTPTQFVFDEATRDAAQVLMAAARATPAQDEVERGNEPPEWLAPLCDIYEQTTGDKPKSAGIMQVALSTPPPVAASEPVAWMYERPNETFPNLGRHRQVSHCRWPATYDWTETPLYALSRQPEGEGK